MIKGSKMSNRFTVTIAAAALVATTGFANAGGIYDYEPAYSSMKDPGYVSMKDEMPAPSRSCYLRADLGYSWSNDPDVNFENIFGITFQNRTYDDAWLAEFGAGCELGRGFRGEISAAFRGDNDLFVVPTPAAPNDPIYTSVNSNTLMFNLYYDIANYRGFVPYVGAGLGIAFHDVENVIFSNAGPLGNNPLFGNEDTDLAWSVMAGVSKQVTPNMSIDVGYRYIDMGSIDSSGLDNTGFLNPPLEIDNITAHELKVGLRYQIGSFFH